MKVIKKITKKFYTAIFTESGRNKAIRIVRLFRLRYFSDYYNNLPVRYKLIDGRNFVVHQNDYLSLEIYLQKAYEELECKVVKSIVSPNDIAIDIGANVGYYTALLSKLVGDSGKVYGFEPGKTTFQKLQQTIEYLNLDNAEIFPIGIGEREETLSFLKSTSGHDAQQSMSKWIGMKLVGGEYEQDTVKILSLDFFLKDKNIETLKVAFIKCDVEGFEKFVLQGSQSLLNSINPPIWQIEINKPALSTNKTEVQEIIMLLNNYSLYYTPLAFSPGVGKEEKIKKVPADVTKLPEICNLFAFPCFGIYSQRSQMLDIE
ncbi:FkbM family methyltransferase [Dolichospermum circinale]|uniref:FkbM family methyltransferase n=1 Tax=Dolichospermum circinale TaxID=109265 RepID=UPI00232E41F7|nr:FkbM family methyltransferase [Dolichospermum circinale]MDB9467030.1 FkbM family methyltransferase [Dolichospermum circinale CS-539/09]MDB9472349.1 FkbM family methyltransferase [Dolichospermum circinale CS-539]